MGQYKVLDRLKDALRFYAKYGFWQDGDEVIDAVRSSKYQRQDYLLHQRSTFQREVEWMPENLAENRYVQMLNTLSGYWADSIQLSEAYPVSDEEFKIASDAYYQETLNYAVITYYHFLLIPGKETYIDIYSLFKGLNPDMTTEAASSLNLCKAKDFNSLDQSYRLPYDTKERSRKAQETMRNDAALALEDLIDYVCANLARENLVVKKDGEWHFKGDEEQYAYLGICFADYLCKKRIDWQVICPAIHFNGSEKTYRKYASEMRTNKRDLPSGRVKISSSFPAKK